MLNNENHCSHLPQIKINKQITFQKLDKENGRKEKQQTICSQKSMIPIPLQMSLELIITSQYLMCTE